MNREPHTLGYYPRQVHMGAVGTRSFLLFSANRSEWPGIQPHSYPSDYPRVLYIVLTLGHSVSVKTVLTI